jgi:NADPH:quinone reductase-like Zn-dependent oxidoreductase
MKTLQIQSFGIDGLQLGDVEKPRVKADQILVKVKALSLNYLDLLVVKGIFNDQLPLPHTAGSDVSGTVEEVGPNVTRFKVGDAVIPTFIKLWRKGEATFEELPWNLRPGLGVQGYFAEYIVVGQDDAVLKPNSLSYLEASTLPIAALSAWNGIRYLGLKQGDPVLLYGTGGVSTFATMFAKVAGLRIFVAGLDDALLLKMKSLGAHHVYNVRKNIRWKDEIMSETYGKGIKGVYESVGGENINHSLSVLSFRGKITYVGLINGFSMNVNVADFVWKQAHLIGMECGSMEDLENLITSIEINNIRPVIEKVFTFDQIKEAFEYLQAGGHFGKIVVKLD